MNPVVLLPANGSRIMSPGSVKNSIKKAANSGCILAGCGVIPRSRHSRQIITFEFVFEKAITFGKRRVRPSSMGSNSITFGWILPP